MKRTVFVLNLFFWAIVLSVNVNAQESKSRLLDAITLTLTYPELYKGITNVRPFQLGGCTEFALVRNDFLAQFDETLSDTITLDSCLFSVAKELLFFENVTDYVYLIDFSEKKGKILLNLGINSEPMQTSTVKIESKVSSSDSTMALEKLTLIYDHYKIVKRRKSRKKVVIVDSENGN